MKKLVIFAVCALMSATASAVNFTFAEVTKVEQSGNGFIAYAGGESTSISALQYTKMKDATGYYLLSVDGQKTIAAGDEFVVERLVADSVGLDGTQPKVFFKGGTTRTFTKAEWLKTLKGQTVRRIYINTPTWEFENFATMEGEFALHSKTAPTKVEAPAPAKVVAPAPKAESKASEAKVDSLPAQASKVEVLVPAQVAPATATPTAPTSANGNFGGITFKVTH